MELSTFSYFCWKGTLYKEVIIWFACVKIHQYTSFSGTRMKLFTIVALLKVFEISVRPQFVDSDCAFYRPDASP